ncbi:MAG: TatD family hydrolase [Chromatiales bacterium]|nr:TatD family hydrolase [Chromatiales bacterium]
MDLVDSHCHLDDDSFAPDREAVIRRAREAGVRQQVIPAIRAADWPRVHDLCEQVSGLFPAYGLHPMYLADHRPEHLDRLGEFLDAHPAVAVGECGLDFYVPGLDVQAQEHYLSGQFVIALSLGLPVIVHARRALDRVLWHIRRNPGLRGVVHSFSGSEQQARQLTDLGFVLGLGGPLTYPRANRLRRLARELPMSALLLETDAPDQPLAGFQGQRNEPARVLTVAMELAAVRGEPAEVIAATTSATARSLFSLPPPGS